MRDDCKRKLLEASGSIAQAIHQMEDLMKICEPTVKEKESFQGVISQLISSAYELSSQSNSTLVFNLRNVKHLTFISDTDDVETIQLANDVAKMYDSFFIAMEKGKIIELWGMLGTVPWEWKTAKRIV